MILNVFFHILYQILKTFFQFISLTNSCTQIYFPLKLIFYKMTAMLYFFLFSFVSKNLTNYGRRHLKLFNCHVSWDTLYICNNYVETSIDGFPQHQLNIIYFLSNIKLLKTTFQESFSLCYLSTVSLTFSINSTEWFRSLFNIFTILRK